MVWVHLSFVFHFDHSLLFQTSDGLVLSRFCASVHSVNCSHYLHPAWIQRWFSNNPTWRETTLKWLQSFQSGKKYMQKPSKTTQSTLDARVANSNSSVPCPSHFPFPAFLPIKASAAFRNFSPEPESKHSSLGQSKAQNCDCRCSKLNALLQREFGLNPVPYIRRQGTAFQKGLQRFWPISLCLVILKVEA